MFYDFFEAIRAALLALSNQPMAVASVVFLAGVNAAIWLLVFERVGFPTGLAVLLLLPPLTFLVPLYLVLARWPSPPAVRFPARRRTVRARPRQRIVRRPGYADPVHGGFDNRHPLRLAADGLPRYRIPLPESTSTPSWPAGDGLDPRLRPRDIGPYGAYT